MDTQTAVTQITAAATKVDAHATQIADLIALMAQLQAGLTKANADLAALSGGPVVAADIDAAVQKLTIAVNKSETVLGTNLSGEPSGLPPPVIPPGSTQIWAWQMLCNEGQMFNIQGAPRYVRFGWGGLRWLMKLIQGPGVASTAFFGGDPFIGVNKSAQFYGPLDGNTTETTPIPPDWLEERVMPANTHWAPLAKEGETFAVTGNAESMLYGIEGRLIWADVPSGTWTVNPAMFDADPAPGDMNKAVYRRVPN